MKRATRTSEKPSSVSRDLTSNDRCNYRQSDITNEMRSKGRLPGRRYRETKEQTFVREAEKIEREREQKYQRFVAQRFS